MSNIWAIPDAHGRNDLLKPLLEKLFKYEDLDLTRDKLVFLGDMIDRGLDSKGVIETIKDLCTKYPQNVFALLGNHEEMALNACSRRGYDDMYLWTINGGQQTIDSYKLKSNNPEDNLAPSMILMNYDHLEWLSKLPLQLEFDGFFFSHAPAPRECYRNIISKDQPFRDNELLWTRTQSEDDESEISREFPNGVVGVCGHNHALCYRPGPLMEPRFYPHYIFADAGCGCYYKAPLVAIECKSRKVIYEWPIEAQGSTQSFCSIEGCTKTALEKAKTCKEHWFEVYD